MPDGLATQANTACAKRRCKPRYSGKRPWRHPSSYHLIHLQPVPGLVIAFIRQRPGNFHCDERASDLIRHPRGVARLAVPPGLDEHDALKPQHQNLGNAKSRIFYPFGLGCWMNIVGSRRK